MTNPIRQIISDDAFTRLVQFNLINKKVLRDFEIKRKYLLARQNGLSANDAILHLLDEYPYLQFDTVRKIIYSVKLPEEMNSGAQLKEN